MRNKLKAITRYGRLSGLLAITACLTVSCAHKSKKTASAGNNPYTSNPYYSTGDSPSTTPSSTGSTQYPTYDDTAAYTPPAAPAAAPSTPETTYPSYPNDNSYPSYTGNANAGVPSYTGAYPTDNSYSSGGYTGGGTSHTVAKGENLYRISLKYGTTVSAIQSANGLGSTTIYPGQVIQIP